MKNSIRGFLFKSISDLKKILTYILIILIVFYIFSGFYFINQSETGVLTGFGKIIDPRVGPGIHYYIPWPAGKVQKVPVKIIKSMIINDFIRSNESLSPYYRFYELTGLSSYCITGDNNIIEISCILHYTISGPVKYLYKTGDTEKLLYEISCHTIVSCCGELKVDEILKRNISSKLKTKLKQTLDFFDMGIDISYIELKEVQPPNAVQQSFDDVINARIDKMKMINEAESYKNEKIPDARGEACKLQENAKIYKNRIISIAEGETSLFLNQLEAYRQSGNVIKEQLYLEFLGKIYKEIDKNYILFSDNQTHPAHLKLLLKKNADKKEE